jgi:hypothetical protein
MIPGLAAADRYAVGGEGEDETKGANTDREPVSVVDPISVPEAKRANTIRGPVPVR